MIVTFLIFLILQSQLYLIAVFILKSSSQAQYNCCFEYKFFY